MSRSSSPSQYTVDIVSTTQTLLADGFGTTADWDKLRTLRKRVTEKRDTCAKIQSQIWSLLNQLNHASDEVNLLDAEITDVLHAITSRRQSAQDRLAGTVLNWEKDKVDDIRCRERTRDEKHTQVVSALENQVHKLESELASVRAVADAQKKMIEEQSSIADKALVEVSRQRRLANRSHGADSSGINSSSDSIRQITGSAVPADYNIRIVHLEAELAAARSVSEMKTQECSQLRRDIVESESARRALSQSLSPQRPSASQEATPEPVPEPVPAMQSMAGIQLCSRRQTLGAPGVLVDAVMERGPAWMAGIRAGDSILKWNGSVIHSMDDVGEITQRLPPHSLITFECLRPGPDGATKTYHGAMTLGSQMATDSHGKSRRKFVITREEGLKQGYY